MYIENFSESIMMIGKNISGLSKVVHNLNREVTKIQSRTMVGLIQSVIIIRRDMDKTPPLIPVDYGNLRASWFASPFRMPDKEGILFGFNANYALWVHEMVDNDIKWSRPNSGPKFLEAAINRNHDVILKIIRGEIQLQ